MRFEPWTRWLGPNRSPQCLSLIKASGIKNVELIGSVLPLSHYIHDEHKEPVPKIDAFVRATVDLGELTKLRVKYEQAYLDSIK